MIHDPVAFFCEHAARHLAAGPHEDSWTAASAVFDRAYPYGMPMMEYAHKTLEQARRAQAANRRRMLADLARYQIADALVSGELGGATAVERETLRELRDASRARGPARQLPAKRRPAPGSVVVTRRARAPYTISNVRWASSFVEQRWMHQDHLGALIRRLATDPVDEYFVIAVAGRQSFSPKGLAFSGPRRVAVCFPDRTEYVDLTRVRQLAIRLGEVRPRDREILAFRKLCRSRALTADIGPIDRRLLRVAAEWRQDVHELHALVLPATDLEIEALSRHRER